MLILRPVTNVYPLLIGTQLYLQKIVWTKTVKHLQKHLLK
jgi:hypothetical protein